MCTFIRNSRLTFVVLFFLLGLVWPRPALCQVDAGSISGVIRDPSGAAIVGAKVTLTSEDTGIVQMTVSTSSGDYTFAPVKIGRYAVSAEYGGFQTVRQNNVTVDVQQKVAVDITLPPGTSKETVIVDAAPPALQTQDASVGQVIESQAINALPLNGRNFTFLAQLSAGVTQDQADTRGLGSSGSFAANGLRPAQNNYLLDGLDNNANLVDFLNGTAYAVRPPVDAIQEFKVETNNYSAESGRSAGAVLNATIKSGTNQFHGDVWEFLRNDKFDAANFFEHGPGITKGKFRQNQFGFTLGGPIRRDKTFFFVDYEGLRVRQAVPYVTTVPTALERSSGYANLSELLSQDDPANPRPPDALGRVFELGQVFDPATTRAITCGVPDPVSGITVPCGSNPPGTSLGFVREPFAGNMIPSNRIDSRSVNLLNLYPSPTNNQLFDNFSANPVIKNTSDQFDARVDHNFSDKDSIFGRLTYSDNPTFIPGPFGGIADGGAFYTGNQEAKSWNTVVSETHFFSPTLVNEARAGYNRISATRTQPNANTPGIPDQFGIPGVPQGNSNGGLGSIFISGLNTLGSNQFMPSIELSTTFQVTDNLTKTMGKHTLKAGFQFQRLGFNILQPPSGRGTWNFGGIYTDIPAQANGNTGIAQLLLIPIPGTVPGAGDFVGGSDSINASNIATTNMNRNYYAGYFQDDLKMTPKFTLNLGLRYEYFGQLIEDNGAQSNFIPVSNIGDQSTFYLTKKQCNVPLSPDFLTAAANDHISIVCSGQPGLGVSQKANFSPRVGFAYQIMPKLVFRGGYGIFFGGFENSALLTYNDFPFQFNLNFPNLVPNAPIIFANGQIGSIFNGLTPIPLTSGAVEPGGVPLIGEDFHNKTPYTQGYNVTAQYQLAHNDTIQVSYVGNTVRHLAVYLNPNTPRQILPPTGLNPLAFSPYPDFSGATFTSFAGNSHYNGLQTNYEHRFSAGLSVLANFTWSSCLTNAIDVLNATSITTYRAAYLPGFGIHRDYGLCDFNINKVFHLSGSYDLPFGRGRTYLRDSSRLVDAFLGGWGTNWILTLQGGQPGTIPCAVSTTSGFGCYADRVKGVDPYAGPHDVNQWLNPAAFATPPLATTIGQTDYSPLGGGPSNFVGPGFHRFDFSLFKQFELTERFRLEFRSEFFNLTNHPNFSNPGFGGNGVTPAPGSLDYTNPGFGRITSTRDGQNDQREIQFALKLYF